MNRPPTHVFLRQPWAGAAVAALLSLLLPATLLSAAAAVESPASQPPAATAPADSGTRDVLDEINAVAPARDAAGSPAARDGDGHPASPPAADRRDRAGESFGYWWGLVRFFAPGLVTASAIGVAGGVLGTFVLLRREALLALALPQVVAAGAALGLRLGWPTLPPALIAASAALLYLAAVRRREGRTGRGAAGGSGGAILPALYVSGLSVSFLVIAGGGAHVEELQNLFTGIDVAVTPARAAVAAPVLLATAASCGLLWRRWLLLAQAPAAAELAGVGPGRWDGLFLVLLTVVLLIGTDSQGVVMVLAMLFLPPAIVLPWTRRVPAALVASVATALVCLTAAFVLSVQRDWPLSQSVGGVGFALFVASRAVSRIARR